MVIVSLITFLAIAIAFNRSYLRELLDMVMPGAEG
jgi:hypothetical protein